MVAITCIDQVDSDLPPYNGAWPSPIPFRRCNQVPIFQWKRTEQWKCTECSNVLFRTFPLWKRTEWLQRAGILVFFYLGPCLSLSLSLREAPPKKNLCSFGHCPFGGGGQNDCQDGLWHLFRGELSKYKQAFAWFWGGQKACQDGLWHLFYRRIFTGGHLLMLVQTLIDHY